MIFPHRSPFSRPVASTKRAIALAVKASWRCSQARCKLCRARGRSVGDASRETPSWWWKAGQSLGFCKTNGGVEKGKSIDKWRMFHCHITKLGQSFIENLRPLWVETHLPSSNGGVYVNLPEIFWKKLKHYWMFGDKRWSETNNYLWTVQLSSRVLHVKVFGCQKWCRMTLTWIEYETAGCEDLGCCFLISGIQELWNI